VIELLASALVAAAAIAFVVEPLTRSAPHDDVLHGPVSADGVARAERLVKEMAARLSTRCSSCGASSESPALFCPRCGQVLVGPAIPYRIEQ